MTIGMMVLLCVFLFFKWDQKHRRFTPETPPANAGLVPTPPPAAPAKGVEAGEALEASRLAELDLPVAPLR